MYLDSHTHLNSPQLFKDYKIYIENFIKIWWKKLVNVWVDFPRTERALKIEENYPEICLSTWWFHPTEPIFKYVENNKYKFTESKLVSWKEYLDLTEKYLTNLAENKKIVAIWECGIDYHYFNNLKDGQTKEEVVKQQEELFILQLNIAKKYNLPVVIHSRDAYYKTAQILENYKDLKIYFHCWWYTEKEVLHAQNNFPNLWIWYDGNITYKKAEDLRNSIKATDKDKILLETDAPYLTPQIVRNKMNQPANVKYIYEYVANLLNIEEKILKKQIENNFISYFVSPI